MKCSDLKRKLKTTQKVSSKKRRTKSPRRTCLRCGLRSSPRRYNGQPLRINKGRKAKNENNFKEPNEISPERRRELEKVFLGRTISAIDRADRNKVGKQKSLNKLKRIRTHGIKKEKKMKLKTEFTKDEDTKIHLDISEQIDVTNNKVPDFKQHNQESFTDNTHKDESQDERPASNIWENKNPFTPECNVRENVNSFIPDCNVWGNEKLTIPECHDMKNVKVVTPNCSVHENFKIVTPDCSVHENVIIVTSDCSVHENEKAAMSNYTQYSYVN